MSLFAAWRVVFVMNSSRNCAPASTPDGRRLQSEGTSVTGGASAAAVVPVAASAVHTSRSRTSRTTAPGRSRA